MAVAWWKSPLAWVLVETCSLLAVFACLQVHMAACERCCGCNKLAGSCGRQTTGLAAAGGLLAFYLVRIMCSTSQCCQAVADLISLLMLLLCRLQVHQCYRN